MTESFYVWEKVYKKCERCNNYECVEGYEFCESCIRELGGAV